jgi:hypothetical protein
MEFFTQRTKRNFEVFEDTVRLGLVVESFFFGALDGVERFVEHPTKRKCFVGHQQLVNRLAMK